MHYMGKGLPAVGALLVIGTVSLLSAQRVPDVTLVDPTVDHLVVSLPSTSFADLNEFLHSEFRDGWFLVPDQSKGFLRARRGSAYVEVFDKGAENSPLGIGYQFAISSSDAQDGKRKAVAYYGHQGMQREFFFTVGTNYHAGQPLGGTFFVSYASPPSTTVHDTPVSSLVTVVTTMPQFRMRELETFQAFGFSSVTIPGGAAVHDTSGLTVCLLERPNDDVFSFGHAALRFRLVQPVGERREVAIGPSGDMKAVFDDEHVWLLLRADLFDPSSAPGGC